MARVTGADLIVQALQREGVDHVFGIAGDHILAVLDVLADQPVRFVGCRHEAAAVHTADVFARSRGGLGVAMYTTAGFLNALSGLAYAQYSEAPVLSISGCAPSSELGRGAMQEIDQVGAAKPFTKGAWLVPDARRIPEYFARAIRLAFSGRRGPVHLTIPIDVQEQVVDEAEVVAFPRSQYVPSETAGATPADIGRVLDLMQASQRPFVIAQGPAGYTAEGGDALRRLIETAHLPLFTEDWARGAVPDAHPQVFGYFERGLNYAARLLAEADLVVLLGRKQDYTISYLQPPAVAADARVVQVTPDADAIAVNRGVDVGLAGDVPTIMAQLAEAAAARQWRPRQPWLDRLRAALKEGEAWYAERGAVSEPLQALHVHRTLAGLLTPDDVVLFDGGDFGDLGRASYPAELPGRFFYICGMGLLGAALPGALGAKLAHPERRVIAFSGDGGFGFNGFELETALRERIPVMVVVGNDGTWGIDYHLQVGLYGRPMAVDLTPGLRYDQLAVAMGAHGEHVATSAALRPAFERALAATERGQAAVVDVALQRFMSPRAQVAINRAKARMGERP